MSTGVFGHSSNKRLTGGSLQMISLGFNGVHGWEGLAKVAGAVVVVGLRVIDGEGDNGVIVASE